MTQIQNFGFIAHFQELNVPNTPHESSRYRQHARLAAGDEPALCHSGYPIPHGQGLGGYIPVGYGGRERADRALRDV